MGQFTTTPLFIQVWLGQYTVKACALPAMALRKYSPTVPLAVMTQDSAQRREGQCAHA